MATAHSNAPRKVTAAQFLDFPDDFPLHSELVEGVVVVAEPHLPHNRAQTSLIVELTNWSRAESGRGEVFLPVDVPIDEWNVFAPDISWYREDRRPDRDALRVPGVPDIAVEARSPSTWKYDLGVKLSRYQRAGVAEVWLVDTESRSVLMFRRSEPDKTEFDVQLEIRAGDQLTSPLLPGLELDIAQLFDR